MADGYGDDGYYFRDNKGVAHGPMDKEDFESLQTKGTIKPGMKIWRQNGGSIFQVKLTRNFTVGKIFSINSFGHAMELFMVSTTVLCMMFIMTMPKLREELKGHWGNAIFLFSLAFFTLGLTLHSLKKTAGRLTDSASDVVCGEV
mmetsp:Transcript_24328/g.65793  ORF Transcript_24328/g.65793 Transcript_24328/m.65793 type:complete len:145 (-) Transcript_24328:309-743(-)